MLELFRGEDGKLHTFKYCYIIKDNHLYITENYNIEKKFNDCFYVVKWGSRRYPRIFCSEKQNNKWIKKNELLGNGDFDSFIDLVANNNTSIICAKGFSKIEMYNCLRHLKEEKDINVESVLKDRLKQRRKVFNEQRKAVYKDWE